jgi:hypothetical protein
MFKHNKVYHSKFILIIFILEIYILKAILPIFFIPRGIGDIN